VGTVVRIPFEVTGWEPEPLELGEPSPVAFRLGHAAQDLLRAADRHQRRRDQRSGLPAGSRPECARGGGQGGLPLQHTGVVDGEWSSSSGVVLPGTGTGALEGLRGTLTIAHEESGAVPTLDYELP
jgi:hypothetical protein